MNALIPVVLASALMAISGAIFGVILARVLWADDLKHAQRIDAIRSKVEVHLRDTIDSLERQITTLKRP